MDNFLGGEAAPQDQQAPIEQEQQDQEYGDFSAEPNFQQQMMPEDDTFTAPAADGDGLVEPEAPQEMNVALMDSEVIPEPAAPPPEPESKDLRVQWRKKNKKELAQKDKEELQHRTAMKEKGTEHLEKVKEMREKRLSARKVENRANNTPKPEAGASFEGSTWQKVNALVSYTSGTHTKDVVRMKTSLNASAA